MSGFWRVTVLGLFCAAGAGAALAVATSTRATASLPPLAADASPGVAVAGDQPVDALPFDSLSSGPVVESANPRIAQQQSVSADPGTQPATPIGSSEGPATDSPPTSEELKARLRAQLERAARLHSGADQDPQPPEAAIEDAGSQTAGKKDKAPGKAAPRIYKIPGEGDHNLAIHIQDSDLRDVLELLSEQGGLNILPSANVQGKVSAALNGVDVDTALEAILRSTGYVARHEGKFIYVGTPADFKSMDQAADKIGTRVYRLNYIRAGDIKDLVTPLLTPGVGSISVTAPAEEGIGADDDKAGGNQFAGGDSVLVHDYKAVLEQIDQVIGAVDRKPAQVAIEAMILSVTLNDEYRFGIDFEFFRNNPHVRLATGTPLPDLNNLNFNQGGLKFAYLDGNTSAFITAVETIGDTNVIASPRLMCINKARAQILIGEQLGYVNTTITETSTAQNVQFLEVGAQLRLRPFISSDGLIRMEVHPELSTGSVQLRGDFTLPEKRVTQVTTNVMIPDGCTVIIGGLMREDLGTTTTQVPLLGSMPGVGFLFRRKTETTQKREILVLITPHIICEPDACCEGDKSAAEFHRRHAIYSDQMSPIAKRYLGRRYYRLAQSAWAGGDREAALRFIDLAVHIDPENRAAIDLRVDIWNGNPVGEHTLVKPDMVGLEIFGPTEDPTDPIGPPFEFPWSDGMELPADAPHQPRAEPVPAGVPLSQAADGQEAAALPELSFAEPMTSRKTQANGLPHSVVTNPESHGEIALPAMATPHPLGVAVSVTPDPSTQPAGAPHNPTPEFHVQGALDSKILPEWLLNNLAKPGAAPPAAAPANPSPAN